jgi:hypothetical protein
MQKLKLVNAFKMSLSAWAVRFKVSNPSPLPLTLSHEFSHNLTPINNKHGESKLVFVTQLGHV